MQIRVAISFLCCLWLSVLVYFSCFCVVLAGDVPHHFDQFLDERLIGLPCRAELRHLLRSAGELLRRNVLLVRSSFSLLLGAFLFISRRQGQSNVLKKYLQPIRTNYEATRQQKKEGVVVQRVCKAFLCPRWCKEKESAKNERSESERKIAPDYYYAPP